MAQKNKENQQKMENLKSLDEVIYTDIEPGIISRQMIESAYLQDKYKEDDPSAQQFDPSLYEKITSLRLDSRNILRIDHLWMMPNLTKLVLNSNKIEVIEHIEMLVNLKELDLSFNYIERIENLDKLVKLEILSLFSNLITKLENLDALENIVILSVGNNLIKTLEGIERFRFLPSLKVLNMEGNPVAQQPNFSMNDYVAAILPDVKYYEYMAITEEQREKAKERFSRELRDIEMNEEMEIRLRAIRAKEDQDAIRLSLCFVEHLNGHQLYTSLWQGDEDGRTLMLVGAAAEDLAEEFDKDMFEVTQEIYKLGLARNEERQQEIRDYQSCLKIGHQEVKQTSEKILEDFVKQKDALFDAARACHKFLEGRLIQGEDEETEESMKYTDRLDSIVNRFDDLVNHVWQQLMSLELHLHEVTEETTTNFQRNMQEKFAKFVEDAQAFFAQLRDIAVHFSENLAEIVSHFITTKLALHDFASVPEELHICMEDREAIGNFIAGMKDTHTQRIDQREDRLMQRSKQYLDDMIDKQTNEELERNRDRVLEINMYLDTLAENLQNLKQEVREELLNEEERKSAW